ncbi:MAG TPA: hypothetical protein VGS57_11960 [Thermoanaerobaculia bacterium]|jgi:hypothetical protein|nr:hypothetical protein [Thermoanaerobaculia bacterium]
MRPATAFLLAFSFVAVATSSLAQDDATPTPTPAPAATYQAATTVHAAALPVSIAGLDALRAQFLAAANARRAEHHLPALRADAKLDRAAQEHALALLAALRAGKPASTVADLGSRLVAAPAGNPAIMAVDRANAGGSPSYHDQTPGRQGDKMASGAIGQAIVVDALSAAQAIDVATKGRTELFESGYMKLGIGAAVDMSGDGPHVVWVAVLTRR